MSIFCSSFVTNKEYQYVEYDKNKSPEGIVNPDEPENNHCGDYDFCKHCLKNPACENEEQDKIDMEKEIEKIKSIIEGTDIGDSMEEESEW